MTFLTSVQTLVLGSHPASGASDPAEHDAWPQKPSSHTKCLHITTEAEAEIREMEAELAQQARHETQCAAH